MAGRLIRILLVFLVLICSMIIPALLIKDQLTQTVERNNWLFIQMSAEALELQILKKIEDSFATPTQVPTDYVELAKKVGGVFLYDENLRKVVVSLRKEQGVQTALVSFTDLSAPSIYFVTDTTGKIVATSELAAIGGVISGIIAVQRIGKIFQAKYKGRTVFAFNTVNPVYGFSVTTCIYTEDIWWRFLLPFVLSICTGFTILLVFLQDHYRSKVLSIRESLEKIASGSADRVKVKDKKISQIVDKLTEEIQRKDRILNRAAQELAAMKETLEKIREKSS